MALRDTSSGVREAAVVTLGSLGGERAHELALGAWTRDSSYEVRAAALTALAGMDSAGSRAVVLAGLSTPSYRDVIQEAAVAAAVMAPDSALIDGLEKILGQQPLAATALATLARKGDTQALARLVRHRDDSRPWVRQWVLDAIDKELENTP